MSIETLLFGASLNSRNLIKLRYAANFSLFRCIVFVLEQFCPPILLWHIKLRDLFYANVVLVEEL